MTSGPTDQQNDLRERLRSLGYLNAPVDRFVLGGAATRQSSAALAGGASARIGVLAGLLLGPAAAVGLAVQVPELITNVTDAAVTAAYLAVMFGVAASVASFLVIMLAGAGARSLDRSPASTTAHRRRAVAAGALIFVVCVAYLTLWWRAAVTTASPAPVFSAAVVAVAVVISLVLGHVVMVAALAVAARSDDGRDADEAAPRTRQTRLPMSSWRATLPLAAIAFAGAAGLLFATAPGTAPASSSQPLTVVPTGERVLVIAIDGVDAALLRRLQSTATLPAFAKLLAAATAAMPSDPDRDPARVWTTIATGQPPERHGISALEGRQLAGVEGRLRPTSRFGALIASATDLVRLTRPTIASASERRIPAFWEVAARAGLRTSVIQWWATWPASEHGEDAGTILTDRALLRLEQGGALDAEIAPASLYASLEKDWPARRQRAHDGGASAVAAGTDADVAAVIERSAALDASIAALAAERALADVDLEVVYLPGLDIAQHTLFAAANGAAAPTAITERVRALEHYYQYLDRLLADLIAGDRAVVLLTQPGRVAAPGDGFVALSGRPSAPQAASTTASPTSVAATVLYLVGVPVADDLAAPPLTGLINAGFRSAHALRTVPTYGPRRILPRRINGKPLDQEMIERMRSLGYVK